MRVELGTTVVNNSQGIPQVAPVGLNLSKPPYDSEGFAGVFLGSKGAGKSNVGALFAEQCYASKIPFIYVDRGSDAFGLRDLGSSVVTFGSFDSASERRIAQRNIDSLESKPYCYKVARSVLEQGYSLVLDCSVQMRHDAAGELNRDGLHNHPLSAFSTFLNVFYSVAQQARRPCMLIVDEAHFFAPQKRSVSIQKLSTEALSVFAHDSRKAGVGTLFLTQRNAAISKSVIFDSNVRIFGRMSHMPDFKAIKEYSPDLEYIQVSSLRTGEAYLVSPRGAIKITFNLRETAALGDTPLFVSQIDKLPDGSDFADETTVRIAGSMGGDWEKV